MRLPVWRRREVTRPRNLLIVAMVLLMLSSVVLLTGARHAPLVLRVIAKGAAFHSTNGIIFGPDGNLYIASVPGREIIVMNPRNGKVIRRLGTEDGVDGPDDLIFGPDNSLYWTEILLGNVGRMTPDGEVTKQFVARGVNPITFSPDGRLFVALCFLGDGLYELDPDLIAPPRPIIEATPGNPYPLGFFNGFAFGPDGRLYGPLFAGGMVISVDVDRPGDPKDDPWTDDTIEVVTEGLHPAAVKFDSKDRLHVVDQGGEVLRVDHLTGDKTVIATLSPGNDNLAFDSQDNLFVSNFMDGSITRILPSGQPRVLSRGGMIFPQGVAALLRPDGRDAVFVANTFSLSEFDGHTGKLVRLVPGHLVGEGLVGAMTISEDGQNLILASWFSHKVQVWDPWADEVLEQYPMWFPLNAIRFRDDIVVAALGMGGVVRASNGAMILPMDGTSVLMPLGLATDGDALWVGDWATGIIWEIGFDGETPLAPVPVAFGLANPEGLALDIDGSLLVVEAGAQRLSRVDLLTGTVSTVVEGLSLGAPGPEGYPPHWGLSGVTVGPSGAIYITGDVDNVLYRIWPR